MTDEELKETQVRIESINDSGAGELLSLSPIPDITNEKWQDAVFYGTEGMPEFMKKNLPAEGRAIALSDDYCCIVIVNKVIGIVPIELIDFIREAPL